MAYTPPTKEPEWASANPTDPVSGQPAILEPIAGKKASGHTRTERPPRQDHNWLFNLIWLWQQYLKSMVQAINVQLSYFVNGCGFGTPYDEQTYTGLNNALEFRYHKNFIEGFHILKWLSDTQVAISNGKCTSDDRLYIIDGFSHLYPQPFSKKIDGAAYALGSGNCGRADGVALTADTWYHLFVFRYTDISTPKVDLCFDTSITGANLPTNTGKRRIMSLKYDGGTYASPGFIRMAQFGDRFVAPIQDLVSGGFAADLATYGSGGSGNRGWQGIEGCCPPDVDVCLHLKSEIQIANLGVSDRFICRSPLEVGADGQGIQSTMWNFLTVGTWQGDMWKVITGNDRRLFTGFHETDTVILQTMSPYLHTIEWIDLRGSDWGSGPSGAGPSRYIDHTP